MGDGNGGKTGQPVLPAAPQQSKLTHSTTTQQAGRAW